MYKNASWTTGGIAEYGGNDPDYSNNTFERCYLACSLNDKTSSIRNNGNSCDSYHYEDAGPDGAMVFIALGGSKTWVSGQYWNDRMSSHQWCNPA